MASKRDAFDSGFPQSGWWGVRAHRLCYVNYQPQGSGAATVTGNDVNSVLRQNGLTVLNNCSPRRVGSRLALHVLAITTYAPSQPSGSAGVGSS